MKPISETDLARLRAGPVFVSFSGGKDSTAAWLWMLENGIQVRVVFADTGWEHPDTYAYVDGMEKRFGKIDRVGYPGGMRKLVEERGFTSSKERFCTDALKRKPLALWQYHHAPSAKRQAPSAKRLPEYDIQAVLVTGIRADESTARARMMPWELTHTKIDGFGHLYIENFRPLLRWTLDEVVAIHQRHGVRPNPLYLRGYKRVGCFPCIYAGKEELRRIADEAPETIDEIERMEAARSAVTGQTSTFFLRKGAADDGSYSFPVRERVAWSRTTHGGINQLLGMADPNDDGGCGTWSLCESGDEGFPV